MAATLVRFYTDSHIDKAIAAQARQRGVDVIRCQDVGLADASDVEHLEYATAQERLVITADADFPRLHAQWQRANRQHAGIIFLQQARKDDIGAVVDYLEFLDQAIRSGAGTLEEDVRNQLIYL